MVCGLMADDDSEFAEPQTGERQSDGPRKSASFHGKVSDRHKH